MSQDYENELVEIASKKDKLVVFAGAGVSTLAGIPIWEKLLKGLETKLSKSTITKNIDNVNPEKYPEIAQKIYNVFEKKYKDRGEKFQEAFKDILSASEWDYSPSQLNIIHVCKHIVTTNFDDTFDYAFKDYNRFSNKTIHPETQILPRFDPQRFTSQSACTVYLHGCKTSDEFIFTEKQYKKHYETPLPPSPVIEFCEYLYKYNHLLFIGFGFTDRNFVKTVENIHKKSIQQNTVYGCPNTNIQHYAFMQDKAKIYDLEIKELNKKPPDEKKDNKIKELEKNKVTFKKNIEELKNYKIKCLLYNQHKDYRDWLNKIVDEINKLPETVKGTKDTLEFK